MKVGTTSPSLSWWGGQNQQGKRRGETGGVNRRGGGEDETGTKRLGRFWAGHLNGVSRPDSSQKRGKKTRSSTASQSIRKHPPSGASYQRIKKTGTLGNLTELEAGIIISRI